jgi:hypothetical protein
VFAFWTFVLVNAQLNFYTQLKTTLAAPEIFLFALLVLNCVPMLSKIHRDQPCQWTRLFNRLFKRALHEPTKILRGTQSVRKINDLDTAEYYFENGNKQVYSLKSACQWFYRIEKSETIPLSFPCLCQRTHVWLYRLAGVPSRIPWAI